MPATAGALVHPFPVPDTVEAWPYARSRLYCPARLRFRATPTSSQPLTPAWPVSSSSAGAYRRRIAAKTGGSQVRLGRHSLAAQAAFRLLSPHAADLTPGPLPVHLPSSSRQALAFPPNVRGRRIAPSSRSLSLYRALPAIRARSQLTRLHHSFSYCGLHVWPAPLTGFSAPCSASAQELRRTQRGKLVLRSLGEAGFRPGVATQTRPQPTYPKRQLVWRAPFIPLANVS